MTTKQKESIIKLRKQVQSLKKEIKRNNWFLFLSSKEKEEVKKVYLMIKKDGWKID